MSFGGGPLGADFALASDSFSSFSGSCHVNYNGSNEPVLLIERTIP